MWIIKNGPIPDDLDVCHTCDNPRCVRIEHLFLGPALVNMRDMIKKGRARHPTGIENGVAKFTAEQVGQILAMLETGLVNNNQISKHFGCDRKTIGQMRKGRLYKTCKACPITPELTELAKQIAANFKRKPSSSWFKPGHA